MFRLSASVGESGVVLQRPAPFDVGQPITANFMLPDAEAPTPLSLRARITLRDEDGEGAAGGSHLAFIDPPREARQTIVRYVARRLGLPSAMSLG